PARWRASPGELRKRFSKALGSTCCCRAWCWAAGGRRRRSPGWSWHTSPRRAPPFRTSRICCGTKKRCCWSKRAPACGERSGKGKRATGKASPQRPWKGRYSWTCNTISPRCCPGCSSPGLRCRALPSGRPSCWSRARRTGAWPWRRATPASQPWWGSRTGSARSSSSPRERGSRWGRSRPRCRGSSSWAPCGSRPAASVDVQIFGVRKSADTRAALRFFAERRVKTHFVDLNERPASPAELRRFAQKFGVRALIDRDAKRFAELGLGSALLSKARAWFREQFTPSSAEEILTVYRGKTSAPYRMVTTYWNMAAALVLHGAIDEQMFADVNGEHMMVYAKLRPFLGELRARLNNPT